MGIWQFLRQWGASGNEVPVFAFMSLHRGETEGVTVTSRKHLQLMLAAFKYTLQLHIKLFDF